MIDAEKLGGFIAAQRKALGYTQAQLAEKLHVTDKAVSRWERGVGLPDLGNMEALAAALQVSLLELMQAQRIEQPHLSTQQAETILADTLVLSKTTRRAAVIADRIILGCFAAGAIFLLLLLAFNGKIVLFSVGSLLTGLIAWGIPLWKRSVSKTVGTSAAVLCSMGFALFSLTLQFFDIAQEVHSGDLAAIEDTIYALVLVVLLFVAVTLLLNIHLIRSQADKKNSVDM